MAEPDIQKLAERVAVLEKRVAELADSGKANAWLDSVGKFAGDDLMKEIFEEGQKIREAEREAVRSA